MWTLVEPSHVVDLLEQDKEVVFVSLEDEFLRKPFAYGLLKKQMVFINEVIENATKDEKNSLLFYADLETNANDNQSGDVNNGD